MQNNLALTYELKRLEALLKYQILDTPNEKEFDNIVQITAQIFDVPVVAITFIDENRQWIKASVGITFCETARNDAVCNYTIRQNAINLIEDMRADERYKKLPYVAGEPCYRFYAGAPLTTESNYRLGALCILDTKTRTLNNEEQQILQMLANVVMAQVEISLRNHELENISKVQQRISSLISNLNTINKKSQTNAERLPERTDNLLTAENLAVLNELMDRQVEFTVHLLNEQIRYKQLQLQNAINRLKNDKLKQQIEKLIMDTNMPD